jgi:hypothetical protein
VFDECEDYEPEVASEPTATNTRKEFLCPNPTCPKGKNQEGNGFKTRLNVKKHTLRAVREVGCGLCLANLTPSDSILSNFNKIIYHEDHDQYQTDYACFLDFTRC